MSISGTQRGSSPERSEGRRRKTKKSSRSYERAMAGTKRDSSTTRTLSPRSDRRRLRAARGLRPLHRRRGWAGRGGATATPGAAKSLSRVSGDNQFSTLPPPNGLPVPLPAPLVVKVSDAYGTGSLGLRSPGALGAQACPPSRPLLRDGRHWRGASTSCSETGSGFYPARAFLIFGTVSFE